VQGSEDVRRVAFGGFHDLLFDVLVDRTICKVSVSRDRHSIGRSEV
jgi:hypothetical protein